MPVNMDPSKKRRRAPLPAAPHPADAGTRFGEETEEDRIKALADAEKSLLKKSKECAEIADDYVRENPWSAVGVAAAVGLALGLIIRGK